MQIFFVLFHLIVQFPLEFNCSLYRKKCHVKSYVHKLLALRLLTTPFENSLLSNFFLYFTSDPSAPPVSVRGHNTSSTSILVTWGYIPAFEKNGIITSYSITYHSLTENHSNSTIVDFPGRQVTLIGLKEFVNYSITVSASTKIGPGPASEPIVVRTGEDSKGFCLLFDFLAQ